MVSTAEEGGMKYSQEKYHQQICTNKHPSDSTQGNVFVSQGYVWVLVLHIYHRCALIIFNMEMFYLNKLKYHIFNAQNRTSVKMTSSILKSHDNYVIPHGINIHKTAT